MIRASSRSRARGRCRTTGRGHRCHAALNAHRDRDEDRVTAPDHGTERAGTRARHRLPHAGASTLATGAGPLLQVERAPRSSARARDKTTAARARPAPIPPTTSSGGPIAIARRPATRTVGERRADRAEHEAEQHPGHQRDEQDLQRRRRAGRRSGGPTARSRARACRESRSSRRARERPSAGEGRLP